MPAKMPAPNKPSQIALLFCSALAGCGAVTSQSVYEGVRSVQKGQSSRPVPDRPELPPYDDYEKERARIRAPSGSGQGPSTNP